MNPTTDDDEIELIGRYIYETLEQMLGEQFFAILDEVAALGHDPEPARTVIVESLRKFADQLEQHTPPQG